MEGDTGQQGGTGVSGSLFTGKLEGYLQSPYGDEFPVSCGTSVTYVIKKKGRHQLDSGSIDRGWGMGGKGRGVI